MQPDMASTQPQDVSATETMDVSASSPAQSSVIMDSNNQFAGMVDTSSDGTTIVNGDDGMPVMSISNHGMILDGLGIPDGSIEWNGQTGTIFDAGHQVVYTIDGNMIFDDMHQVAYTIQDNTIFDKLHQVVATLQKA